MYSHKAHNTVLHNSTPRVKIAKIHVPIEKHQPTYNWHLTDWMKHCIPAQNSETATIDASATSTALWFLPDGVS